jgi:hypothetical protein
MPETIVDGIWHWYDVASDLQEQGGLTDVTINPLSVEESSCGGSWNDIDFYLSWVPEKFTMSQFSQTLVTAFERVVGYRPFCRYEDEDGLVTVEWSKVDPTERYAVLKHTSGVVKLKKLKGS